MAGMGLHEGRMPRRALVVLWPSFLVAILAEGFFFSMFHPEDLMIAGRAIDLPPLAIYTIGFFCFWAFAALASLLSSYLLSVPYKQRRGL